MAPKTSTDKFKMRWFDEPVNNCHRVLFDCVRSLHMNGRERLDKNMRCLRLYGNVDLIGMGPGSYTQTVTPALPENRIKLNIVSSMIDTSGARISKMKPKVQFLTSGGDFTSQKDAKNLTKFMLGAFYKNKINALHQQGFRDSQIFDIGAVKHYIEDGDIKSERVLAGVELYTDPFDSLYGKPQALYQVKYVARTSLEAMYPEFKSAIMQARDEIDSSIKTQDRIEDYIVVIEAWRLAVNGDNPGRHVLCIGNETLVDEEYEFDYFPFTFFRWSKPVIGFYGQSLADRLTSLQIEINKMLRIIQQSFHLGAAFKVFLEYGSKVSKEHIGNSIGSIIYYMGKPPQFYTPSVVHAEYFEHLKFLISSAYQEAGISLQSAASQLPAGIDKASGRAIREMNVTESERFALVSQEYEATFLTTASIYVDLANKIKKDGGNFKVTSQSKSFVEQIEWNKVAPLDKNAYILQSFPVSMLPHEPAGRLAFVQELITSGMVPASFGLELLEFPDLESYLNVKNAAIEDLMFTLEKLIEGEFEAPEPYQSLQEGISFMQSAYLRARREKVPEARLELIRRWITQADALVNPPQAIQQAQQQQQLQQAQQAPTGPAPAGPAPLSPSAQQQQGIAS